MEAAVTISGIFGPYLLIVGLWMLIHKKNCMKICDSIRKAPAAIHVLAWTSLLIGLTLINFFNVWQSNALVLITLLGWAYFARGIIILFVPQLYLKMETHENTCINTGACLRVIWGIILCWVAMSAP